jgi:hypothetical protein
MFFDVIKHLQRVANDASLCRHHRARIGVTYNFKFGLLHILQFIWLFSSHLQRPLSYFKCCCTIKQTMLKSNSD